MLRRILYLLGVEDGPDPAWKPAGYRYTTSVHHDEAGAVAATRRRDAVVIAQRKIAAQRAVPRSTETP